MIHDKHRRNVFVAVQAIISYSLDIEDISDAWERVLELCLLLLRTSKFTIRPRMEARDVVHLKDGELSECKS